MATTQIVFETHWSSEDNDRGIASGWNHGALSVRGRELAAQLGSRRRDDELDAVLVSDLRRAIETASIAFEGTDLPVLHDWRLRECDYGDLNGAPVEAVRAHVTGVNDRFPGGESWAEAVSRVQGALADVVGRWAGGRVLIIGHMSAYWALENRLNGMPLESLGAEFAWREGWEYLADC